jgi:hypothetical protein
MKQYPTISREIHYGRPVYAFDKLDGSNIRAEWTPKKKFHKFGSKKRLIGTDQDFLPEVIELIKSDFEKQMSDIFRRERYAKAIGFFEFWGQNSFAGVHVDEDHEVSLIDVNPHKKGILLPRIFLRLYGKLNIARLLYQGNANSMLEDDVRRGELRGMTFEGVVCKGAPLKNGYPPLMFKIKNDAWISKLKEYCQGNEKLFNELL